MARRDDDDDTLDGCGALLASDDVLDDADVAALVLTVDTRPLRRGGDRGAASTSTGSYSPMRDTSIADRLRAEGLASFERRMADVGRGLSRPGRIRLASHGGISERRDAVSRRRDPRIRGGARPGPLANVLQSREADGADVFYVVAAGKSESRGDGRMGGTLGE